MRTLITAIIMTGSMVLTGCSSLKQSDTYMKQSNACFDHGRSGYSCPPTDKAVAKISDQRTAAQNDLRLLHEEKERLEAELAVTTQQSTERDRLSEELSAVKQRIMDLEVQLGHN